MNWIKIDPKNLPQGEVLAWNGERFYYGTLRFAANVPSWGVYGMGGTAHVVYIRNCTHYVIPTPPKQQQARRSRQINRK